VISHKHASIIMGYFCRCSVKFHKNENSFLLWFFHLIWNHITGHHFLSSWLIFWNLITALLICL